MEKGGGRVGGRLETGEKGENFGYPYVHAVLNLLTFENSLRIDVQCY